MYRNYQETDLSYEEWESVLRLSTHWDFTSLRELALNVINPSTSHSGSRLGRTYSLKDSIVPALSALCERKAPISLNEALDMKIEDLLLVMTVREGIRNQAIQAYAAEIPRPVCVVFKLWASVTDDFSYSLPKKSPQKGPPRRKTPTYGQMSARLVVDLIATATAILKRAPTPRDRLSVALVFLLTSHTLTAFLR
jgi:hypothetical protein